jgi:hypothetical protein
MTSLCNVDIILAHMSSLFPMRTTLNLDDDVLSVVKQYAETRSVGLGKAVSELVRRGIAAPVPTRTINGLLIFDPPADTPKVSTKRVRELEAEE